MINSDIESNLLYSDGTATFDDVSKHGLIYAENLNPPRESSVAGEAPNPISSVKIVV
jgi:hypothetical protein